MSCGLLAQFRAARLDVQKRLEELDAAHAIKRPFSAWGDTAELVFLSDAYFREAERCEVFGVRGSRREDALARGRRYNALARELIAGDLRTSFLDLREHFAAIGQVDASAQLELGEQSIRDGMVDFPLDVYEAREAEQLLERGFAVARAGGGVALCDYALEQAEELDRLRAQREGHNAPVVGIVMGVIFLVAAIGNIIDCANKGTCGNAEIILLISGLLAVGGISIYFSVAELIKIAAAAGIPLP